MAGKGRKIHTANATSGYNKKGRHIGPQRQPLLYTLANSTNPEKTPKQHNPNHNKHNHNYHNNYENNNNNNNTITKDTEKNLESQRCIPHSWSLFQYNYPLLHRENH